MRGSNVYKTMFFLEQNIVPSWRTVPFDICNATETGRATGYVVIVYLSRTLCFYSVCVFIIEVTFMFFILFFFFVHFDIFLVQLSNKLHLKLLLM